MILAITNIYNKKKYDEAARTNVQSQNKFTWSKYIENFLLKFNLYHLWEGKAHTVYTNIKDFMKKEFVKYWSSKLTNCTGVNGGNKLRNYSQFKHEFKMENYVLQNSLYQRRSYSKLRISAHPLAIETGRYSRPKTHECERVCELCKSGMVENERHLLISCTLYQHERASFQQKINQYTTINLRESNAYLSIMQCISGDDDVSHDVCYFVDTCFKKRRDIFSILPPKIWQKHSFMNYLHIYPYLHCNP